MATILFKDRIYTNSKIVRTEADLASIDSTKVYIQVMNETAPQDITIEQGSYFTVNEI